MTTTAANNQGRASGPVIRVVRRCLTVLAFVGAAGMATARAENVLEDVSYNTLPGGKVELTLKLSGPVNEPQIFTTDTPPRIALDLADTRSAVAQRNLTINVGSTTSVSAIEAAGRTRVVVDLVRPSSHVTKIDGNNLVLTIANGVTGSAEATASTNNNPTKAIAAGNVQISNVDFRRGANGEGRIIITFTGEGATTDVKRDGDKITLDLYNAQLPNNLAQRLDLLDFATPVQFVETRSRGNGARMEISAKGPYEQLAYQTGNEYILEIAPKREDPKKKDKNAPPEYTGARVTFNFQDIPTRSVLQLIADVSDLNIVVADTVSGNVTLRLINVPWDQALDLVLQAKGLDKRRRDNVIWVAPQKEIADREQAIEDARIALEQRVELQSAYIPVSYGKAKDIAALINSSGGSGGGAAGGAAPAGGGAGGGAGAVSGFLSPRGSVTWDERTNTLLVNDTPDKINEIRELVLTLDRPVQQVLIESRIVIATDDFAKELGVRFGVSGGYEDNNGNVISLSGTQAAVDQMTNIALINRFEGNRGTPVSNPSVIPGGVAVPSLGNRLGVNLPAATPAGSFGLAILGADYLLDLELSAAQTEARGEVISSPRVITTNQQEAVIKQGQEIGYVTFQQGGAGGGGQATVSFKDAVLELKVTPTITNDNRVFLALAVKKDNIAALVPNPGGGFVPQIDKREINTSVLVDDGQTVVLGGVYEVEKRDDIKKVPFLGDVPGLGALFRNKKNTSDKAELLIFVTPRILNESLK
ncbi:type IV pilus secretin PilQ [Tahibacter amnicola]|uniref:Type IV pilus secretin PilQ n=1 Tax=Tahibacter amnicola TaxID=2976241 RepID=A0ABY6BDJ2_9GAMM|nr:type IV pilus secretin PilQ [Tahibacter amnicola]UXI67877.1 type IV pilus secretin PilQ [Tahibacter amnicola]